MNKILAVLVNATKENPKPNPKQNQPTKKPEAQSHEERM